MLRTAAESANNPEAALQLRLFLAQNPTPNLYAGAELHLEAFWKLCSCRSVGFGEGPIPYTAIVEYGKNLQLDEELLEDFVEILLAMDRAYLTTRHEINNPKSNGPAVSVPKSKKKKAPVKAEG